VLGIRWDGKWLELAGESSLLILSLLTGGASLDILNYIVLHVGPIEQLLYLGICPLNARVSS
jgi:hypothetical protein